ncbi:MAG: dihydrofolate reductase family protein, partial [Bacteroidales bacterium]
FKHAYIDGGKTIQSFVNLQLIDEIIITKVPVLLGEGIPLFGKTFKDIKLEKAKACAFTNDFVQVKYSVNYE